MCRNVYLNVVKKVGKFNIEMGKRCMGKNVMQGKFSSSIVFSSENWTLCFPG